MPRIIFFLLTAMLSQFCVAQVVINELDSDTPGTDDREFIELKSETPNFSLNNYVIVLFNGTGSLANKSYYVISLNGFTTDANGLFVIGNSLVSPVPDKLLPESIFQNGPDGVGLYWGSTADFPNNTIATTANLVDALVYETNDADATELMSLLGVTEQLDEALNNASATQSIQRKNDGTYEIKTPTPKANNDGSGIIFNGVTCSVQSAQVNEGGTIQLTFNTQTPVVSESSFSISVTNETFTTQDYTGATNVVFPIGSTTASLTLSLVDDNFDEGDEVARVTFGSLPSGFIRLNDFLEVRIVDNDFTIASYGTPSNPTYGLVLPTIPDGYYATLEGLSGEALKQELQNIIANPNTVRAHSYGDVTEILKIADRNPLNSNQVWMMYVEQPRAILDFQTGSSNVGKWNREHIFPQSRGGFSNATSDLADGINIWLPTSANDIAAGHSDAHHLRAEDGPENSSRSNRDYGSDYNGPTGNLGSWKGDVARALFYMAIRYNGLSLVNGNPSDTSVGQMGDLASLLAWNVTDKADDFEMNRNNYIYTWQNNRNPFIDYPNLADYIWGSQAGQAWFSSLTIDTPISSSRIAVYPNPAVDFVNVSGVENGVITFFNALGVEVMKTEFSSNQPISLKLSSGIYFLRMESVNEIITRKIIIR